MTYQGPTLNNILIFTGHVDGPGLFAHLITLLSILLIIVTLPVSLIFAVKVVQVIESSFVIFLILTSGFPHVFEVNLYLVIMYRYHY